MDEGIAPVISVITVVYNAAIALEKTIQSVLAQTLPVEFIIVDGGSMDGTVSIIESYKDHLSAWVSEKDNGIYHAMNKGVKMASGKWICFLNAGDTFVDNLVIQRIVKEISVNPDADILYGNILVSKAIGVTKTRIAAEPCNLQRMYFCHQAAFTKRSLLQQLPFDEQYKMSADLKFFKQCYYDNCRFVHLNFPVVHYDTSGISNTNREAGLRDNISVIKEIDKGLSKYKFLAKLYFVIYWRKLNKK